MTKPKVTIFTDGACSGNPGAGGWGALLIYPDQQQTLSGGSAQTTNNQMELTAAIMALESLEEPHEITLYTDSQYVKNGIESWLANWKRSGWVNSKKDPVANKELWQQLDSARTRHTVQWKWVRGHAGNEYNEQVDQLARREIARLRGKAFEEKPIAKTNTPQDPNAIVIYTSVDIAPKAKDGAWAVVIVTPEGQTEAARAMQGTNDYQLALTAVVTALETIPPTGTVTVYTENETVQKGATTWIKNWRKNGWKNSKGEPIAHQALWQRIDAVIADRTVKFAAPPLMQPPHERAVELAKKAAQS